MALVIEDLEQHVVGASSERRTAGMKVPPNFMKAGALKPKRYDPHYTDEVSPDVAGHDQANRIRRTDCH